MWPKWLVSKKDVVPTVEIETGSIHRNPLEIRLIWNSFTTDCGFLLLKSRPKRSSRTRIQTYKVGMLMASPLPCEFRS